MNEQTLAIDAARIAYELAMSTEGNFQVVVRAREMENPEEAVRLALAGRAALETSHGYLNRGTFKAQASWDGDNVTMNLDHADRPGVGLITAVVTLTASSPLSVKSELMAIHDSIDLLHRLEDDADHAYADLSDFVFIIDDRA